MAIIKEKTVKISSVIENLLPSGLCDGEAEKSESSVEGFLKISDGGYEITSSEMTEGGKLVTDIFICAGSVRVKRVGAIESDMLFEEGLSHKSLYSIPPYSFDAEVATKRIRNSMKRDGGRIDIYYDMKIGGAKKRVKMRIECV
ncbi:MAG: DUF1934 domain-containing protein [Ruminococcaceae bacterium]|nr:DUF1934 domain-containing protein [Oscillospiraceae bacterium]